MKKICNLLLLFLLSISVFSCKEKENSKEVNVIDTPSVESFEIPKNLSSRFYWQFHNVNQDEEYGSRYEIYLFDNNLKESTYLLTLPNNMVPSIRNDIHIDYEDLKSISNIWSWWGGGGIGCSVFYKEGYLYIYRSLYEENENPFIDPDNILLKVQCESSDCIINNYEFLTDMNADAGENVNRNN